MKIIKLDDVFRDLQAGVTVGVLLIPQSMSYASLAYLPPSPGLYTGCIPLLIFALFTTSIHISIGPVAPICLLVGNALTKIVGTDSVGPKTEQTNEQFQAAASGLALVVGIWLIMMSVLRLGFIVKYLSVPVMTGFITGAAFIVAVNQLKTFFGLNCEKTRYLYTTLYNCLTAMDTFCWRTTLLSILSLLFLSGFKLIKAPRWFPTPFILMLVTTLLSYGCNFEGMGIEIVGDVPSGIPKPWFPAIISPRVMISEGFIVALVLYVGSLGLANSLARDSSLNYEVKANSEFVAFGMANIVGSFFHSLPPSGSFSRSALCLEMEARTPLHGIFTALFMLAALYVTSAFKFLPRCVLSAVIVMSVQRHMLNGSKELLYLAKARSSDFFEFFVCMCAVCFLGITLGITIGALLSLVNYVYMTSFTDIGKGDRSNMSEIGTRFEQDSEWSFRCKTINGDYLEKPEEHLEPDTSLCLLEMLPHQQLKVIQPKAGIYYANVTEVVHSIMQVFKSNQEGLELDLIYSPFLDSTSARKILDCLGFASTTVNILIISNCSDNVYSDLKRYARTKMHQIALDRVKIKAPYFRYIKS